MVWLAVCGRALVLCGKLSWHSSRTDFMEVELVVDDLIGRTMTNLQRTRYLIDGNSPVCQYHLSSLLNLLVIGGG